MAVELTQWTVIRPTRLGAPRRTGGDVVWLKSPAGEMHVLALGLLADGTRAAVDGLASGSKLPKTVLGEILAGQGDSPPPLEAWHMAGAAGASRPWTFYYLDRTEPSYVFLRPPEPWSSPKAFPIAGLRPQLRAQLEELIRGDRVPDDVIAALFAAAVPSGAVPDPTRPAERKPDRG